MQVNDIEIEKVSDKNQSSQFQLIKKDNVQKEGKKKFNASCNADNCVIF